MNVRCSHDFFSNLFGSVTLVCTGEEVLCCLAQPTLVSTLSSPSLTLLRLYRPQFKYVTLSLMPRIEPKGLGIAGDVAPNLNLNLLTDFCPSTD